MLVAEVPVAEVPVAEVPVAEVPVAEVLARWEHFLDFLIESTACHVQQDERFYSQSPHGWG
ncbi:MAG: hypothetical protein AAGC97_10675 [Planctomycetota bacterium]